MYVSSLVDVDDERDVERDEERDEEGAGVGERDVKELLELERVRDD